MVQFQRLPQKLAIQVGIDLCCGNAFMTQHILDGPEVGATFQEMRSERVPECMRRNCFLNASLRSQVFDDQENHDPG